MMSLINNRCKNAFKRGTIEDFMYILDHIITEKIQQQEKKQNMKNREQDQEAIKKKCNMNLRQPYRHHKAYVTH